VVRARSLRPLVKTRALGMTPPGARESAPFTVFGYFDNQPLELFQSNLKSV